MMEYPGLRTLIVFFCLLIMVIMLVSCSNAYEDCIENQKAEYRTRNAKVSYGEILARQRDFEMMCSKFKTK